MKLIMTSSPTGPLDGSRPVDGLDNMNEFRKRLASCWKADARCLMITASPSAHRASEEMTTFFADTMKKEGFSFTCFDLLDDRNQDMTGCELRSYDVIWLGGGHVPTQNDFFSKLDLREKLQNYDGLVIGISAGSMNCAEWVYSEPEEAGEAADPSYRRWQPGLALTWRHVLPHFQMVRHNVIDGLRLYEDIVLPDSLGNEFINLPDGSYIIRDESGKETVYGEAWMAKDGMLYQICRTDECRLL